MTGQEAFDSFYNQWNGKPLEAEDPSNLDQCFDEAFGYVDFLGIPRDTIRHLYAKDIYLSPNPDTLFYFDLIPNTPELIPQAGDVGVFDTTVGVAGHVCVCSGKGDTNNFTSLDQNWDGKLYCRVVGHNYRGFLGVLRPKMFNVVVSPPIVPQAEIAEASGDVPAVTSQPEGVTTNQSVVDVPVASDIPSSASTQQNPSPEMPPETAPIKQDSGFFSWIANLIDSILKSLLGVKK